MKKAFLTLALILMLILALAACDGGGGGSRFYPAGSEGLEYVVRPIDGETCAVIVGIGTCTDTDIVIPRKIDGYKVMGIMESAFERCSTLTSITIPDSVIGIGDAAFSNCTNLTSVTIPDGVMFIESSTFYNCTSLTSITIPDSVMGIGNSAFSGCSSLTTITFDGTKAQFENISTGDYWIKNTPLTTVHCTDGDIVND